MLCKAFVTTPFLKCRYQRLKSGSKFSNEKFSPNLRSKSHRDWRVLGSFQQPSDGDDVDIDALAARLAAEAERLRRLQGLSDDGEGEGEGAREVGVPGNQGVGAGLASSPFGYETKATEAEILASVGDGGFCASEFELLQELGQISIQQLESSPDASPLDTPERVAKAAVIAYTATYFSGMPFQDPVITLLKEYLPGAKSVACNELLVMQHLQQGFPDVTEKWQAASAVINQNPPIVQVLGYFLAGQSERAQLADAVETDPEDAGDTIWLVQKWDGMAPLALYPSAQQTSGYGLGRVFGGGKAARRDRSSMLKAICKGALSALNFVHCRQVVHGSLGSGSILLSTFNDQEWSRLVVKIDNFGFARWVTSPNGLPTRKGRPWEQKDALFPSPLPADDSPLLVGQRLDLQQMAVVLLEVILSALAENGQNEGTSAGSIQRVFGDVYGWNVDQYIRFVSEEPDWLAAAEFLGSDDNAGWEMIRRLVQGNSSCDEILASRFCHP